jgi:hypothetical protein
MNALTPEQAYRRAGGRRRYNKQRAVAVAARRLHLMGRLVCLGWFFPSGWIAEQAADFDVSQHTIYRDLRALRVRAMQAKRIALWRVADDRRW